MTNDHYNHSDTDARHARKVERVRENLPASFVLEPTDIDYRVKGYAR